MKYLETLVILHNCIEGLVFHSETGGLFSVPRETAIMMEKMIAKYAAKEMANDEEALLEDYFRNYLGDRKVRTTYVPKGLDETTHLLRLEIVISTTCNMCCKYCYAHGGTYGYAELTMTCADAKKYIENLIVGRYDEIDTVMFFGGEPTLAPETFSTCCKVITDLAKRGIIKKQPRFTMVTNGTLLSDNVVQTIADYDICTTISIDGPQDINDQLRVFANGEGSYVDILKGLRSMQKFGIKPNMIEATYTKLHEKNGYKRSDIYEHLRKITGIDKIMIENCQDNGCNLDLTIPVNEEYRPLFEEAAPTMEALMAEARLISTLTAENMPDLTCEAGLTSVAILPDGCLYPCHMFIKNNFYCIDKYSNQYGLTNYASVKSTLLGLRKPIHKECTKCAAKPVCVPCPASFLEKDYDLVLNMNCERKKRHFENGMLDLVKYLKTTEGREELHSRLERMRDSIHECSI